MNYTKTASLSFEETERNPLVLVDVRTLQELLKAIVENAVQSITSNHHTQRKSTSTDEDDFLGMEEVLQLLKVSKMTIHNWKKKGIIKSYKVGRKLYFKKSELNEALKRQKYAINR